jgi:hypothetical protein
MMTNDIRPDEQFVFYMDQLLLRLMRRDMDDIDVKELICVDQLDELFHTFKKHFRL